MRLLIDSKRFIDFCHGVEEVVSTLETASLVCLPFVLLAEIRAGQHLVRKGSAQARTLGLLLQEPDVRVIHSTDTTTHHYASIYSQLRKAGTPIPTNDIWIAALAIEHDLILYSRDTHFDHIPVLPRL